MFFFDIGIVFELCKVWVGQFDVGLVVWVVGIVCQKFFILVFNLLEIENVVVCLGCKDCVVGLVVCDWIDNCVMFVFEGCVLLVDVVIVCCCVQLFYVNICDGLFVVMVFEYNFIFVIYCVLVFWVGWVKLFNFFGYVV